MYFPRHRHGRPVRELLADHPAPSAAATASPARGRHAAPRVAADTEASLTAQPTTEPAVATASATRPTVPHRIDRHVEEPPSSTYFDSRVGSREVAALLDDGDDGDDRQTFSAASRARRAARDTLTKVAAIRSRLRTASRLAGVDLVSHDLATNAIAHRIHVLRHVDNQLAAALDRLERGAGRTAHARRVLRQFTTYGGTRVATPPTRRRHLNRLALAVAATDAARALAQRSTRVLVAETRHGEQLVGAVDALLERLPATPPTILRLIRATLPPADRRDWWRELCSTFAECQPDERRAHALSHLLHAPSTIWTSWTTTRSATPSQSSTDNEQR